MRVFVTGTDTGIGKTLLSGVLALQFGAHYWKPIQAGLEGGTDSLTVAGWIGADRVLPEGAVLRAPMSPNQAAELEGRRLDLAGFALPECPGPLVVEGAGGLLVPINETHTMLDLISRLGLPAVLAARSGLGTLNHTLLSVAALQRAGLDLLGVVLIGSAHPQNARDIERFAGVPILGHIPPLKQVNRESLLKIKINL